MRFQKFVDALYEAGWRAPLDAQHTEIRKLWASMFPTVAELEDALEDAKHEAANQRKRDECIGRYGAADEIDRLRNVCRNVYEVWAGSEGMPMPETAPEAYLVQLIEQMRDEAKAGLMPNDPASGARSVPLERPVGCKE